MKHIRKYTSFHKYKAIWSYLASRNPPHAIYVLIGLFTVALTIIPIFYVVLRALGADAASKMRLFDERILTLTQNTVLLAGVVTLSSIVLGVTAAYITVRTDVVGKKAWQWLLALPLTIPPYIGAVTYIMVFGRSGLFQTLWNQFHLFDHEVNRHPFNIHSFWGVAFVLTMFTYPYVYLIARASLLKMSAHHVESAKTLGKSGVQIFFRVVLPLLRPAIGSGAVLVFLYVLSDFGAVSVLRYMTLTLAIYFHRTGLDTASASIISIIPIAITLPVLWIEKASKGKRRFEQNASTQTPNTIIELRKTKVIAFLFLSLLWAFSFIIPLGVLFYWSFHGIGSGAADMRWMRYVFNSIWLATWVSILCTMLALPVVYMKNRHPSPLTSLIDRLSVAGYAIPGIIVALGFIFVFNRHLPSLYATPVMPIVALIVRFFPQAHQAQTAALQSLSPKLDEAARSLGCPAWKTLWKVTLPNMVPGLLSAAALVFVSSIKELPVTLMLRPPDFDTLAVRVYYEAVDGIYTLAAPAALGMIFISVLVLTQLMKTSKRSL